jgi:hypothetical protein
LLFVHNVDHFEIVTAAGPANNSFTGRAPVTLIYGRPVGRAPVQWIIGVQAETLLWHRAATLVLL